MNRMCSMLKSLLLLLFFCQLFIMAKAQDNSNASEDNNDAEENVLYRNDIFISPDSVLSWKSDRRFAYVKNLDSLSQSRRVPQRNRRESKKLSDASLLLSLTSYNIFLFRR